MAKGFDSLLVTTNLASNRKFGRLTIPERWCAVHGVWAIAAESPLRGYLLIAADEPAVERDYAKQADVSLTVARSTVRKMRSLGMLEMDDELGIEHVHDWHEHQQEPKPSESREAWKRRKRESRAKKSPCPDDVTRDTPLVSRGCHTPEVEEEVKEETSSLRVEDRPEIIKLSEQLAGWIQRNDPKAKPTAGSRRWLDAIRLLLDTDGRTVKEVEATIDWCQADDFWRGNILSAPKLRQKFSQLALQMQRKPTGHRESPSDLLQALGATT